MMIHAPSRTMNLVTISVVLLTTFQLCCTASIPTQDDPFAVNITMNGYQTTKEDEYAFVRYALPDEELTIIGYSPLVSMNAAHHMLTYACSSPGSDQPFWTGGSPCGGGDQIIIHGWARNAPALSLPDDVGFAVGRNTPYKHIVVNIHYLAILKGDFSGNQILLSRKPRKYRAGVMLGGTNDIYLKAKAHTIRTPFSCQYQGPPVSIFAARVHAHQWARVNSLYRIRDEKITQIVKGDPQWPQSFYPLSSPVDIQAGDVIVGQCVYDNDEDRVIQVGSTHKDEMCNVYAMYSFKPIDDQQHAVNAPFSSCWGNAVSQMARLIPPDSEVPPIKPADMSPNTGDHNQHAEHAMNAPPDDDYSSENENNPYRSEERTNGDLNPILPYLGLPEYDYVDAQSYDDLLPQHLTYGKDQTVKLHNAKLMSSSVMYTNVDTWPDVKSLPTPLGEIGGIALNNLGSELVVFHRGSRKWEFKYFTGNYQFRNDVYGPIEEDVLIHVDTRTGQMKSRWGAKMFYLPHGLTIDHEGNYWVTDIAMHQVLMFKPTDLTHPALTVGKLFQAGAGATHFCRPADVAVMKNGDFFVADGYCNNRIAKFNRKGEYITEWGSGTSGVRDADGFPPPNQWNIVHSIALNENAQLLCAADRENYRIQCFNLTSGEFLRQIRVEKKKSIGAIYAIEFAPNTNGTILFAVTGGAQVTTKKVYMIDAQNGDILTSFDSIPSLNAPHDITVSMNAREIFVGELATTPGQALHKFELSIRKDLPGQTFTKPSSLQDKNFRISLMIMVAFAVPVLLAVIIGCLVRLRNLRKLHRLNTVLSNGKQMIDGQSSSFLNGWINRHHGFKRLEQFSDGENDPLDNPMDEDSAEEITTIPSNGSTTAAKNPAF